MVVNIAYLIIGLCVGILIGMFLFAFGMVGMIGGTLKSADNDDGDPYLFLDLDENPDKIMSRHYAVFKVDGSRVHPHD